MSGYNTGSLPYVTIPLFPLGYFFIIVFDVRKKINF